MKRTFIFTMVMLSVITTTWSQQGSISTILSPKENNGQKPTINKNGVKADEPGTVLAMFLDSCAVAGDYKALCSAGIDQAQLESAVDVYNKQAGSYMIATPDKEDQQETYTRLKGESISLPGDHYLFQVIKIDRSDRNNPIKDFGAFAVVSHDTKNGTYWIVEFGIGNK